MDNIGDWLYIVLLIIAGVSSMFGSGNKKKKRRVATPSEPSGQAEPRPFSGWDMSDWETVEEKRHAKPKKNRKTLHRPGFERPDAFQQKKAEIAAAYSTGNQPFLKGETPQAQDSLAVSPVEEAMLGVQPEGVFTDMAELRKAIICAEILNRKY